MRQVRFYERQSFGPAAGMFVLGMGILGLVLLIPDLQGRVEALRGIPGFGCLATSAFLLNMFTMTTWVQEDEIRVQFGRLVPYHTKSISLNTVFNAEVVDCTPLVPARIWGAHRGPFKGKTTQFYNTRGKRGVLIETEKGPYLVGSQLPEKLLEAIMKSPRGAGEM